MQPAQIIDYKPKARDMDATANFTRLPNEFFDYHMPRMKTASEMKVVLVIARKTIGWNKTEDGISLSQFVQLTGLNREEVTRGLNAAIKHGSVTRYQKGDSFVYAANLVGKTDYQDISASRENRLKKVVTGRKSRPDTVIDGRENRLEVVGKTDQKEPFASRENRHTKESTLNKDLNKVLPPYPPPEKPIAEVAKEQKTTPAPKPELKPETVELLGFIKSLAGGKLPPCFKDKEIWLDNRVKQFGGAIVREMIIANEVAGWKPTEYMAAILKRLKDGGSNDRGRPNMGTNGGAAARTFGANGQNRHPPDDPSKAAMLARLGLG